MPAAPVTAVPLVDVPPGVAALLAASRRLVAHAELVEDRHRSVRQQAEQAGWSSPAATAARALFACEGLTVAAHCRDLREAAGALCAYAARVVEGKAVHDAAALAAGEPGAGAGVGATT